MRTARIAAAGLVTVLGTGLLAVAATTNGAEPTPQVRPASGFAHPRQNPYYPLRPGTISRLHGGEDGQRLHERVAVTDHTKSIQGVRTTVVRDVLRRADGSVAEKTHDWYAPDNRGNVWYFGEATATYDRHGHVVSREGSWRAGRHGAVAGIIMPTHPKPTDAYRQEYYAGHAEDQAWIVQRHGVVRVPLGTFRHVVRSFEWTRLEPGVLSVKLYARGLGIVREHDVAGGNELFQLVHVSHR
jgi:hypothetical protein